MDLLLILVLVILGCMFPGMLLDCMKMDPEHKDYREKRYGLCACFGAILLLLVLVLN